MRESVKQMEKWSVRCLAIILVLSLFFSSCTSKKISRKTKPECKEHMSAASKETQRILDESMRAKAEESKRKLQAEASKKPYILETFIAYNY